MTDKYKPVPRVRMTLKAQPSGVVPAALGSAFITCESGDAGYRVVIKSETLQEAQQVHNWLARLNSSPVSAGEPFQSRVLPWLLECFGAEIASDTVERNHRFLEEALELVQACGCPSDEAHKLVDYVYGREVGEKSQEVGGVMVTLAALCLAQGLDMRLPGSYPERAAAAAPAQGQQVEWRTTAVMLEQANAGLAQLNGKLRAELSALKAQQTAHVSVPRELAVRLQRFCQRPHSSRDEADALDIELRALLNGGEA